MKTDARPVPLIAVGGGAFLIPETLPGISRVVRVPHGSTRQRRGGRHRPGLGRGRPASSATCRATTRSRGDHAGRGDRGGRGRGRSRRRCDVEVEDMPLAYLPGNSLRVRVRVVGDIAAAGAA
jgi:hypothetical protein